MSEPHRPVGGEQPLARPVDDQPLARPVVGKPEEASQEDTGENRPVAEEQREAPREEGPQEEEDKGLIDKIKDKLTGN